ncbi:hypothetical protein LCGC14_0404700 [marine sediment metagenome]|uniref:Translin family protein n=1 Tax=marine sediment metagenome TaxID=412755 RepID=A0A0F9SVQ5_9ZZZZ|nr:MAG: Translin family protein [Candidatus Lokiarchaeum sp. GC14_75]
MNLKKAFSEINNSFDDMFLDREKILKFSRIIVRDCSICIKNIHRKEFGLYQERINNTKTNLENLVTLVDKNPGVFEKYLKVPEQEYAEGMIFYSIIRRNEIPLPSDLQIKPLNFVLGLADVIGELRRYALDNIRNSQTSELNYILECMDDIYTQLFSIDYPAGVTKDLRHKVDVARNIIEKTRGDVSLAIQMNELRECFDK